MDLKLLLWESKLAVALVLLIGARCIDRVLYTRLTFDYNEYLWYLSNIILPVAFLFTSWPVVWAKMLFTSTLLYQSFDVHDIEQRCSIDDITPEMRAFPHYKFAIMALFDTLFNIMSAFPTPHIGGNLANVLNQATLPFNIILSMIFLGTNYRRCHILGAILVFYGTFCT